ncbi:hypothetical protein JYK22_31760 [Nonomuraea sp. RK-328]|nr:hypothetical protein [Nonomuraea sp. RK-328]
MDLVEQGDAFAAFWQERHLCTLSTARPGAPPHVVPVDGRRWSTLEGRAVLRTGAEEVADAERRYAARYKPPRANPSRVVVEIQVTRVLGNV